MRECKISRETLYHYQCSACEKWWAIGDIKLDRAYCPHCGLYQIVPVCLALSG